MKYAYSTDDEYYRSEEFDSAEEAARCGFAENEHHDTLYVGEVATPPMPEDFIAADDILEKAGVSAEYSGDWAEKWDTSTKAQRDELTDLLQDVMRDWRIRHDLTPTFYNVENPKACTRAQFQE